MDNDHITPADWAAYFSTGSMSAKKLQLITHIHSHVAQCKACADIRYSGLKAARSLEECTAPVVNKRLDAFSAVASFSNATTTSFTKDFFCVDFLIRNEKSVFLSDTLEQYGKAKIYAFIFDDSMSVITEDMDNRIHISIENSTLSISFPTDEVESIMIGSDDSSYTEVTLSPSGKAFLDSLTIDSLYTLLVHIR